MIMADILKILLLIMGGFLIFQSNWLVTAALFPRLVERSREQYARPFRLTWVGLLLVTPLVTLATFIFQSGKNPLLQILGFVILAAPLLLGLGGSAGLCDRIGAGLPSPDDDAQPWKRVLRGGTVLSLTFLLPFIGWMGLSIWTLVTGCAAAVLALWGGRKPVVAPVEAGGAEVQTASA